MKSFLSQLINVVILMILDNYPFLDYLPIGALDGATEIGPSFTNPALTIKLSRRHTTTKIITIRITVRRAKKK